jgi:small subunit ribosomal protein S1
MKLEVQVLEVDKDNRRLSLGHKQVEENPWEVFAGTFTPGSVHEGTLTGRNGSNFTVALPYGVEGSVTVKHLRKADGGKAELEEKLPFMVLEFNGDARRIVLSHTRTFEAGDDVVEAAPAKRGRKSVEDHGHAPSIRSVNEKVEKSTLGDLGVLSGLKEAMENTERGKAPKRKSRRTEEDDADLDMEG